MSGKMAILTTTRAPRLEETVPPSHDFILTLPLERSSPLWLCWVASWNSGLFGLEDPGGGRERVNYKNQENAIGGQGRQISPTPIMLGNTCSKKRVFICTDSPGKCAAEHWGELLDSVNDNSPTVSRHSDIRDRKAARLPGIEKASCGF